MNYLAHILLSYPNNDEMLGNFLGDFVRKRDLENLPKEVQDGVQKHRMIDRYTDQHDSVKESIQLLRPELGRYSSVAIDIINDHFLSVHWNDYSPIDIKDFCEHFYFIMKREKEILPSKLRAQMDIMINHDFLMSTSDDHRLFKTMKHMERRTSFKSNFTESLTILKDNRAFFEEQFRILFDDLIKLCKV